MKMATTSTSTGITPRCSELSTKASIRAAKSVYFPVAEWFTVPHAIVKTLLLLFSLLLIIMMFSWESEGIRIYDLDESTDNINYRNYIYSYVGVAFFTIVYSMSMTILGCGGCEISALSQALVSGAYLLVWLVTSALISATMDNLYHTKYARDRALDILLLRLANGCGFLVVTSFIVDILLAFVALRAMDMNDVILTQDMGESKRSSVSHVAPISSKHITGRGSYRHRISAMKKSSVSKQYYPAL